MEKATAKVEPVRTDLESEGGPRGANNPRTASAAFSDARGLKKRLGGGKLGQTSASIR